MLKCGTVGQARRPGSSDKTIMDVGATENNTFNVKVDSGSFNVVNGRMNVTAQNSAIQ